MSAFFSKLTVLCFALISLLAFLDLSCSTTPKPTKLASRFEKDAPWLKPKILNGDRIKAKFGSYGVKVLMQDEQKGLRISNLYSEGKDGHVMRVVAMVDFVPTVDPRLKAAHREIIAGGSIGAVLVKHQFAVDKHIIFKGEISDVPEKILHAMRVSPTKLATTVYELKAKIGDELLPYCTITELYSPEFLTLLDLNLILAREQIGLIGPNNVAETLSDEVPAEAVSTVFERLRQSFSRIAI